MISACRNTVAWEKKHVSLKTNFLQTFTISMKIVINHLNKRSQIKNWNRILIIQPKVKINGSRTKYTLVSDGCLSIHLINTNIFWAYICHPFSMAFRVLRSLSIAKHQSVKHIHKHGFWSWNMVSFRMLHKHTPFLPQISQKIIDQTWMDWWHLCREALCFHLSEYVGSQMERKEGSLLERVLKEPGVGKPLHWWLKEMKHLNSLKCLKYKNRNS